MKAAWRSLRSTPGPTLVVVLTLAIAIGANTSIFSVVQGVLLRSLGYEDDQRLVVLWSRSGEGEDLFRLSPADYRDVREEAESFSGQAALYRSIGSTLTGLEPPVRVGSLAVTTRLFNVLRARPALGQFFSDEDETPGGPQKLVITHESWSRRFDADPELVGSTVELDGESYTVVGVTEPGFQFPPGNDQVELYFPMRLGAGILLDRDHRMFDGIARLGSGVALETAQAELDAMGARLAREFADTNYGWNLVARPLRAELLGDLKTTLWVLFGAVFLVLLVACVNIANVLVARSTVTGRELAVRSALGARPWELLRRSFAESALLGAAGAALGVLLAFWGTSVLRVVMPAEILRLADIRVDGGVLLFALCLALGSTLLFGSLPAIRGMAPDLLESLKASSSGGGAARGGRRLRELMVVVEIALAIVLLVGAVLMVRSFSRLHQTDPGFRQDSVVSVALKLPRSRYGRAEWKPFFEQLVDRTESLPGVHRAGAVSDLPMSAIGLGFELEFTTPGLDAQLPTSRPNAEVRLTLPGYFEAMGMEIVSGRSLQAIEAADRIPTVVNQTLAERYFRDNDPIGRTLNLESVGEAEIVGVVSDIRHQGLLSKYESEIFMLYGQPIATVEMHVVVHSELETAAVASAVRGVLAEMDPGVLPSQVVAIDDLLWESIAQPRFNTALLTGLALCAMLLAAVGAYGIVTYTVSLRTSEIGVRMAMGADSLSTLSMVIRQALGIVLAGAALGIVGALGTSRFLSRLLFDIEPTDPLTYVLVLLAALLVGVLAAFTPAVRATRIDPVVALRDE